MTAPTTDELIELCRPALWEEFYTLLCQVQPSDFNAYEIAAMLLPLRQAHARRQAREHPPAVLELVPQR